MFLLVFAGIALLVGAFSIYNTLSILAAQRTRESALLRALGASRGQVLRVQLTESLMIGIVASVAGLAGGLGIATGLKTLFSAFGGALPDGGLVVDPGSAAIAVVVGVVVTAVAGVAPARRASRVPPIAALREVAAEAGVVSRGRVVAGAGLTAVGAVAVLLGALGPGGAPLTGAGAAVLLAGMVVIGPVGARPIASALGAPLQRLGGVSGTLARDNARRNPRRTAATAAALMVGIAVVSLFTVVAGSLKASLQDGVSRSFAGDLAIATPGFGGGALDPGLAAQVAALPQVDDAVGLGQGAARIGDTNHQLTVADPARLARVVDLDVTAGALTSVGDAGLAVSQSLAEDNGWAVGTTLPVTFADGSRRTFAIAAIYDRTQIAGDVLISREAWAPHATQDLDRAVFLTVADGAGLAAAADAVRTVTRQAGDPDVQTRQEYVAAASESVDSLLGIVYVLLLLAIVIALMGIANTLALSVHERTRELGLLRAVGATRRQVRAMVRGESIVVATFGTLGGVGLGLFCGWGLVSAVGGTALSVFSAPSGQLVIVLLAGVVVGGLASVRPARRAARLDVLQAIGTE